MLFWPPGARGLTALGVSRDRTSWRVIGARTTATNPMSAFCAKSASPAPTTWPSTSECTCVRAATAWAVTWPPRRTACASGRSRRSALGAAGRQFITGCRSTATMSTALTGSGSRCRTLEESLPHVPMCSWMRACLFMIFCVACRFSLYLSREHKCQKF